MYNDKDDIEKQDAHEHTPMKHMLHMVLCCGIPIVIVLSLPLIARFSPAVAGVLGLIAPFLCPIMMGGMLFMMLGRKNKASCCDKSTKIENEIIDSNKKVY